jgi:hypothetical protein
MRHILDLDQDAPGPAPLQPETDEVLQAHPAALVTIPVSLKKIDGPVRTQGLPRVAASTKTLPALGTTPVRILRANPYRASVKLMSVGEPLLFAFNEAAASDPSTLAVWPAGLQYECTAKVEIWVASSTGTTQLTVVCEYWAAGDA